MWEKLFVNIEWYTLRLVLAAFCGALVGFERKRRNKDAGIRTHVLVSMGAALFTILSEFAFDKYNADRIAAQVITGVGFLGAGVIFLRGRAITGLTTAAGIWTVAGIGMASGSGMYALAAVATLLVVALQFLMHRLLPSHDAKYWQLDVLLKPDATLQTLWDALAQIPGAEVEDFHITRYDTGEMLVKLTCASHSPLDVERSLQLMNDCPDVLEIKG